MNVAIRNKKLKALLDLRIGLGAAKLPINIKGIGLDFAYRIEGGNRGARKFWRECLPRLKYHNPAVSMAVNRSSNQTGPATLSVFFTEPPVDGFSTGSPGASSSTKPPTSSSPDGSDDGVESIDMKDLHEMDILNKFLDATKAQPYEATPEEKIELQEVKEFEEKSEADRKVQDRLNRVKAQERAMLQLAKGAVS